jgi:hypothetical protein
MINSYVIDGSASQAVSFNQLIITNPSSSEAKVQFANSGDIYELARGESISLSSSASEESDTISVVFDRISPSNEIKVLEVRGVSGGGPSVDTNFLNDNLIQDADRFHTGEGFDFFWENIREIFGDDVTSSFEQSRRSISGIGGNSNDQYKQFFELSNNADNSQSFVGVQGNNDDSAQSFMVVKKGDPNIEQTLNRVYLNSGLVQLVAQRIIANALNKEAFFNLDSGTGGAFLKSELLRINIPSADAVGKVLTVHNTTTKEAQFKFPTPKSVAETFNINMTDDAAFNISEGEFVAVRTTIPAGIYNRSRFYIQNINGIGIGESCNVRQAIYLTNGALVAQTAQNIQNAIIGPQRYTLNLPSDLVFESATEVFLVFGANDFVGTFNVQCPRYRFKGGNPPTSQIFRFEFPVGSLPLSLASITRLIENDFFYYQIFGV